MIVYGKNNLLLANKMAREAVMSGDNVKWGKAMALLKAYTGRAPIWFYDYFMEFSNESI